MATESYNVLARLELGAQQAVKGLDSVVKKLKGLQGDVKKVNIGFQGLVAKALAFGAAYFGINAVVRGIRGLIGGIHDANAEAEAMQASLATVYAAVEKVSFAQASEDAKILFRRLEQIAIVSTATGPELMQVFQGIYGPLRNAGLTIDQIVTTTNNAAVAASALGVDFAQASRDISAMARGTAGLDVKTFSLLQSMGLIKETTEQWNKLAPEKRAKKLMDVMSNIGGQAAEAYGKTWKGLSSTFVDIMGAFKRAFGSAVFERMKKTLEKVNKYLLDNRERIEAYLRVLGERVGTIFDKVINNAGAAYHNAVNNIDAIRARMAELYARFEALKPTILAGAKVAMAVQLAATAFNLIAPVVSALVTAISGIMSAVGAFAAAGGISGIIASIGSALSTLSAWIGMFMATVEAAGVTGALAALAETVWIVIAPFALVAAAIAAVVLGILKFKDTLWKMLQPLFSTFQSIGKQLYGIFKDLWVAVKPILEIIGGALLMQLIAQLRIAAWVIDKILLPPLRLAAKIIRWVFEAILHPVFKALEPVLLAVVKAFEWLGEKINALADIISDVIDTIGGIIGGVGDAIGDAASSAWSHTGGWVVDQIFGSDDGGGQRLGDSQWFKDLEEKAKNQVIVNKMLKEQAAIQKKINDDVAKAQRDAREKAILQGERPTVHNDFRGSKISVKQEFREADPDNVWVQLRDGLEREATARTRTGYADALAR